MAKKQTPENKIKEAIKHFLVMRGALPIRINSGASKFGKRLIWMNSEPGCSDLIVCYRGLFLAIETKRPDLPLSDPKIQPTDQQLDFLKKVVNAGGIGFVANSVDQTMEILDEIDEKIESGQFVWPSVKR